MERFLLLGPTGLEAAHGQRQCLYYGFLPTSELSRGHDRVRAVELWRSSRHFRQGGPRQDYPPGLQEDCQEIGPNYCPPAQVRQRGLWYGYC